MNHIIKRLLIVFCIVLLQFDANGDNLTIGITSFSAGRIVRNSSGAYAVQYHITDHLGSVRNQTSNT